MRSNWEYNIKLKNIDILSTELQFKKVFVFFIYYISIIWDKFEIFFKFLYLKDDMDGDEKSWLKNQSYIFIFNLMKDSKGWLRL